LFYKQFKQAKADAKTIFISPSTVSTINRQNLYKIFSQNITKKKEKKGGIPKVYFNLSARIFLF